MKKALHRNGLVAQFTYAVQIVVMVFYPALALAGPDDPSVVGGSATVAQPDANTTVVQQTSDRAVINWRGFSIDVNELVEFQQPGAETVVLNRVTGSDPSSIMGQLLANGRVFVVNPNGIVFGPDSRVDVAGLVATTFDIRNDEFMNGNLSFAQDPTAALKAIINQGEIRVSDNGFVFLVAPAVSNEGLIIANLGQVVLGAGNSLTLDFNGDGLVTYQIDGKVLDQVTGPNGQSMRDAVLNKGTIQANGGTVVLHANAADAVFDSLVNNDGVIEAQSLATSGGKVVLEANSSAEFNGIGWQNNLGQVEAEDGVVLNTGEIDVAAIEAGAQAGTVVLSGAYVGVSGSIDAQGGGTVLVASSTRTLLTSTATIDVSGQGSGSAGNAVVWSDADTLFYGTILGRGGDTGGAGASVEVSGHHRLGFRGDVDLSAAAGTAGVLLLDPAVVDFLAGAADRDDAPDVTGAFLNPGADLDPITVQAADAPQDATEPFSVGEGELEGVAVGTIILEANGDGANSFTTSGGAVVLDLAGGVNIVVRHTGAAVGAVALGLLTINTAGAGTITVQGSNTGANAGTVTVGAMTAAGGGAILIDTNNGNVALNGAVSSVGGTVTVRADGGTGAITGAGSVSGTIVTLVGSGAGDIGAVGDLLGVTVTTRLDVTTGGGSALVESTGGGVLPLGTVNLGGGTFILEVTNNDITDADGGAATNITAGNVDLSTLGAAGGAIGTSVNPIETDIATLFADTQNGGIFIDDVGATGVILDTVVAREGGFTPILGGGGQVTTNGVTGTFDVILRSVGDIVLGSVTSPDTLTLTTTAGSIFDGNQASTNLLAENVGVSPSGAIGQSVDPIDITSETTDAIVTASGGVFLNLANQGVLSNAIALGAGNDVSVTAVGTTLSIGLLSAPDAVTITANGPALTDANAGAPNITGASLSITSNNDVGTVGDPIDTTITSAFLVETSTSGNEVYIRDTGVPTSVGAKVADSNVILQFNAGANNYTFVAATDTLTGSGTGITFENTTEGIVIGAAGINAGVQDVVLTAFTSISDAGGALLTADQATLTANTSIGALGSPIDTTVNTLTATASGGGVFINETNALSLTATATGTGNDIIVDAAGLLTVVSATAPDLVDLQTTAGSIVRSAAGTQVTGTIATLQASGAIGALGAPLGTSVGTMAATATGGGLFVSNGQALTMTTLIAGGDISITATGNLALPAAGLSAPGFAVTLDATGDLSVGAGTLTAISLDISARVVGTAVNHLITATNTLTVAASGGAIYVDNASANLTIVTATAAGFAGDVEITNTGNIALGAVTAAGDDVVLSAGGAITDNNGGAVNVTASSLNITAPGGIGVGDSLEVDVDSLTANGGGPGAFIDNAGDLSLTAASLGASGSYSASSITIQPLGGVLTIPGGQNLRLVSNGGPVVMLDQTDTLAVTGGATIFIQAGTPGTEASAVLGNLTTAGGSVTITADSHVTIGLVNAGAGDVFITSNNGLILDGNGVAPNIIANNVILIGNTPSASDLETDRETWFGRSEARDAELRIYTTEFDLQTATVATTGAAKSFMAAKLILDQAAEASALTTFNSEQSQADTAELTANIASAVALGLGIAADVAGFIAGPAQGIPLVGDGGAMTVERALAIAARLAEIVSTTATFIAVDEQGQADDAHAEYLVLQATRISTESSLLLATLLDDDANDGLGVLTATLAAAQVARDQSFSVRDQMVAAEAAANAVGTPAQALGVSATGTVTVTAPNSSIYLTSPAGMTLGNVSASNTAGTADMVVTVGTAGGGADNLNINGIIGADRVLQLATLDGSVLQFGGSTITTADLIVSCTNAINLGVVNASRFAASNTGAGGVNLTNTGALNITTLNGVVGITSSGGGVGINNAGTVTISSEIDASAGVQTVFVGTTGSILSGSGGTTNISASSLSMTAVTGIGTGATRLVTQVSFLEATTGTGGINILNDGPLTLQDILSLNGIAVNVTGANGGINISTQSPLTVVDDMVGPGAIVLTAPEEVPLVAGDDLTIGDGPGPDAGVLIRSTASTVTLQGGDRVIINNDATVISFGLLTMDAGAGSVVDSGDGFGSFANFGGTLTAPSITINALEDVLTGVLTSTVSATGTLTVVTRDDIGVDLLNGSAPSNSWGTVILRAGTDGTGSVIDVNGLANNVASTNLTVSAGDNSGGVDTTIPPDAADDFFAGANAIELNTTIATLTSAEVANGGNILITDAGGGLTVTQAITGTVSGVASGNITISTNGGALTIASPTAFGASFYAGSGVRNRGIEAGVAAEMGDGSGGTGNVFLSTTDQNNLVVGNSSLTALATVPDIGALGGTVTLRTNTAGLATDTLGQIRDGDTVTDVVPRINIIATGLRAEGSGGFATAANPMETLLDTVTGRFNANGWFLLNKQSVTVGTVDGASGILDTDLAATFGPVTVRAANLNDPAITVAANTIAAGQVLLQADETTGGAAGDNITVNAGVRVVSTTAGVLVRAGDSLSIGLGAALSGFTLTELTAGFGDNDDIGFGTIAGTVGQDAGTGTNSRNVTLTTRDDLNFVAGGQVVTTAAGATVTLTADTDNSGIGTIIDTDAAVDIQAANLRVFAATGIDLDTDISTLIVARLSVSGGTVDINELDTVSANGLALGEVTAIEGAFNLTAAATAAITDANGNTNNVSANSMVVNVTAGFGTAGNIIETEIRTLFTTGAISGTFNLDNTGSLDILIGGIGAGGTLSDVRIKSESMLIGGTILASNNVDLTAFGGAITSTGLIAFDVIATSMVAFSTLGIGESILPLRTTNTAALPFNLEATTNTGGIFYENVGPLVIGGVSPLAAGVLAIVGDIEIRTIAAGFNTPLTVTESVSTADNITLRADGIADAGAPPCFDDLTVNAGTQVVSSGKDVTLIAEDDILIFGTVSAGDTLTATPAAPVDLDSCGSLFYPGGGGGALFGIDVVITSPNDIDLGTIVAVNSVTLEAGTDGTGGVTDNNGATTNIFARSLSVTARDSIDTDAEIERLTFATLLDDVVPLAGSIDISDRGGDMTVDVVATTNLADSVRLSSTGGLTDGNAAAFNITTPTLTLSAGTGSIDLDTNITTLVAANISGAGNMNIRNFNSWTIGTPAGNVSAADGDVYLSNGGGTMTLASLLAAGSVVAVDGRVTLESAEFILDGNLFSMNVTATEFVAIAGSGIGINAALGIDALETNVRNFEGQSGAFVTAANGMYIRNTGRRLMIGGVGVLDETRGGGAADIRSAGPLTVAMSTIFSGAVQLEADETLGPDESVWIESTVVVQSTSANVNIYSGDDILIGGQVMAATSVNLEAGRNVLATDLDGRGSVLDSNGSLVDVVAQSLTVLAVGGTAGNAIDLDTNITTLTRADVSGAALGGSAGGIDINDVTGGLTIGALGASTTNGNVVINATGGNLTFAGPVTAAGAGADAMLTTTGSGDIVLAAVAANVTATDVVTLGAAASITDGDATSDVIAATLNATAGTGIDVDTAIATLTALVTGVGAIDVNDTAGGLNVLSAVTQGVGTITLNATSGNLALGTVSANSGGSAVNLTTTTSGAITDLNGGTANVIGSTLTATAIDGMDTDTSIATLVASVTGTGSIDVDETDGLVVTSATTFLGNISVFAVDGLTATLVTASTGGGVGNVDLTSSGSSVILGSVTAAADLVEVRAGREITDGLAGEAANATSLSLVLVSGTGIGTADDIDTVVTNLEGASGSGVFTLTNTGALVIGGLGSVVGLSGQGALTISTLSPITVNEDILMAGAVSLTSADTGAGAADDDITLNAAVSSTGSSVTVNSGDNIVFNAGGLVSARTTATLVADTVALSGDTGAVVNNTAGVVDIIADTTDITASNAIDVEVNVGTVTRANSTVLGDVTVDDLAGGVNVNTSTTLAGSITLTATSGNLSATTVTASTGGGVGNIALTTFTSGDVNLGVATAAADNVTLTAAGSVRNSTGAASNVISSTLTATSVSGTDIQTTIDTLTSATVTGAGNLRLTDTAGGLAVTLASTANGNVTIVATGDLTIGNDDTAVAGLDGGVHAGGSGGLVTLTSTTDIVDAADAGTDNLNVTGNGFVAISGSGIGDAGAFESNVRFFEGNGGTGGIALTNTGALTVGGIGSLTATTATEAVTITATSPLTVAMNVTAAGLITLTAGETADAGVFVDDLTINSGVTVFSIGDGVTLRAGDDVIVGGRVIAATTAIMTAGFGDLDTGGSITDGNASLVNVIAPTVTLSATGVTGGIDLDMTTTTVTATVTSAGAIDLSDSAGGLTIGAAGVSTANGNIAVNAIGGTLTVTGAVTAAGAGADVTLTTTGAGDIALGAGAANVTATDVVNLTASGSITDGDAASDVTSDTLNATAGTGIDVDTTIVTLTALVTGAGAIDVSDSAGGMNVQSAATLGVGTITLATTAGNLALGTVNANAGASAVTLTTTTSGAITDLNGGAVNVTGSTLTATAVDGIDTDTTIATLIASVTGTGSIDLDETNSLVVTSATTLLGNVSILANDDLTATLVTASTGGGVGNVDLISVNADVILGSVTAAGDRVDVTAGQEITDGLAGEAANVTALGAVLLAGTGLGTFDDIDTTVTNLEGAGGSGAFNLSNTGALVIGGVSSAVGFDAHGAITITTTSPLTINETIDSEFDVTLTAGEDGDNANLDQLTINAPVSGHNVSLNAGDDVIVNDTVSASENLTIRAGDGVRLNDFIFAGELASITTGDLGVGIDDTAVTCPNTLVFTTTGGIFADDILLTVASDLTLGVLKAVNAITVTSLGGSILIGDDGAGLEGVLIAGTSVTLNAANDIAFRRGGMTTGGLGAENTAIRFGTLLTMAAGTDGTGSIVDSNTETEFDVTGRDVTASSTTGTGITFDAQVDTLNSVVATSGAIDVSDDGGDLSVGVVATDAASAVTLTATGAITDLNGSVTNNVTGASLVATTGAGVNLDTIITAGGTLTATVSGDGDINVRNASGGALTVTAATVTGAGDASVTNNSTMTVALASTANGDVTLSGTSLVLTAVFAGGAGAGNGGIAATATTGDILLNGLTATGDNVTLTAAGTINQDGDGLTDIVADSVLFLGTAGVGVANGAIQVNVSTLAGRFATGGFFVTDTAGGVTVGDVAGTAGVADTALGSVDAITIIALSPLTIAANVTGSGTVTLTSSESATPSVDNLTINADALVSSSAANVVLSAGDNVDIFGFVSAAVGASTITAGAGDLDASGSITNVETGISHVTLTGGTLTLLASGNNGSLGISLDTTASTIDADVTGTTTGGIAIDNTASAAAPTLTLTSPSTAATTGDGSITLTNSGGDLTVLSATTAATTGTGDVTIVEDGGALIVTTVTATSTTTGSGDVSISGSGGLTTVGTVTTGTAAVTSGDASVTIDAANGLAVTTVTTNSTLGDASISVENTGGAAALTTLTATTTTGDGSVDVQADGGLTVVTSVTTSATTGDASQTIDVTGGATSLPTLSATAVGGDGSIDVQTAGGTLTLGTATTTAGAGDASIDVSATGGATGITSLSATTTTGDGSVSVDTESALTLGTATTSATLGDAQIDVTGGGGTTTITSLTTTATAGDASVLVDRDGGALSVTTTTTSVTTGDASIEVNGTGGLTTLTTASATATGSGTADIDVDAEGGLTVVTSLTTSTTSGDGSIFVESTGGAAGIAALSTTTTTGDGSIAVDTEGALTLGTATTSATLGDAQIDVTGGGGTTTITSLTTTATAGDASVLVDRDGGTLSVTTTTTSVSSGDASIEIHGAGGLTTLTTASATATTTGSADVDIDAEGGLTVVTSLTTSATTGDGSIFVESTGGATGIPLATTSVTTGDGSLTVSATGGPTVLTTLSATAAGGIGSIDVETSGGTLTLGAATTTAGAGDASIDVNATGGATGITALSATTTTGDGSISVDTESALTLGTATTSATLGDAQIDVTGGGGTTTITSLTTTATAGDASVLVDRDGGAVSVTTTTTSVSSGDASIEIHGSGGLTTLTTASATATTTGSADVDIDAEGGLTVVTSLTTSATTGDGSIFVESTGGATGIPLATTSVTTGDGSLTVNATGGPTVLTTLSATAAGGIGSIDVETSGGTLTLGTATTTAGAGDASIDVSATGGATGITALSATTTTGDGSISVDTESALTLGTATTSATLGDAQIDVTGGGGTTTITTLTATATAGDASVLVNRDGGALLVTTTTTSVTSGDGSIDIHGTGGTVTVTTATATATAGGDADITASATSADLTLTTITSVGDDGDITGTTIGGGNINIDVLTAVGDRVTLDSTGNVTDGDATNDITALELVAVTDGGFGTAVDPVETTVSFVEGTGGTLAFQQRNDGALTIGILTNSDESGVTATTEIDIRTTGAGAPESITVVENVESLASFVTLVAAETAGAGFGDDVSVDPFVTVTAATDLTVSAGDDIVIAGALVFGAAGGAANNATLTAGAGDLDTGGSIVDLNDAAENLIGLATTSSLVASAVGGNAPANGLAIDLDTRITTVTAATVGTTVGGIQVGGIRIEDTQFGLTVNSATTELGSVTLSATGGDLTVAGTGVTAGTGAAVAGNGNIVLNTFTGMGAAGPSTSGNINLGVGAATGVLTALGDLVELNSVGAVLDGQGDGNPAEAAVLAASNITARLLLVNATNGFGTAANRIETRLTEDLDLDGAVDAGEDVNGNGILDGTIAGTFDQVGWFQTNVGALIVGTVTSVDGTVAAGLHETNLENDGAATADVIIQAISPLFVVNDIVAAGDILLIADEIADPGVWADDVRIGEDINGNGVLDAGEDVNGNGFLDTFVLVKSTLGSIEVQAGDDVFLALGSTLEAFGSVTIRAGFDVDEGDLDGRGSATILGSINPGVPPGGGGPGTVGGGPVVITAIDDIILGLVVAPNGLFVFTEFGNILDGNGNALNIQANGLVTLTAVRGVIGLPSDAIEIEVQAGQVVANAGGSIDRVSVNLTGDIEPDGRFFSSQTAPGLELFNFSVLGGDGVDEVTDRFFKYTSDRQIMQSGERDHGMPGFYTFLMFYLGDEVVNPEALWAWDTSKDGVW